MSRRREGRKQLAKAITGRQNRFLTLTLCHWPRCIGNLTVSRSATHRHRHRRCQHRGCNSNSRRSKCCLSCMNARVVVLALRGARVYSTAKAQSMCQLPVRLTQTASRMRRCCSSYTCSLCLLEAGNRQHHPTSATLTHLLPVLVPCVSNSLGSQLVHPAGLTRQTKHSNCLPCDTPTPCYAVNSVVGERLWTLARPTCSCAAKLGRQVACCDGDGGWHARWRHTAAVFCAVARGDHNRDADCVCHVCDGIFHRLGPGASWHPKRQRHDRWLDGILCNPVQACRCAAAGECAGGWSSAGLRLERTSLV